MSTLAPRLPPQRAAPRLWGWFVGGAVLCALVVLVHQWPARWLTPWVEQLSGGRVQCRETQGSLWQGSAYLALGSGGAGSPLTAWPHRLHWHLSPQGWTGVRLDLWTEANGPGDTWRWDLQWRPSGWQVNVSDIDWQFPTAWLAALGAPFNTIQPQGLMRLRSQGWQWLQGPNQAQASGQLMLTLAQFATRLSSLQPLGDYQLVIRGAAAPRIELSTLQGRLQMKGEGSWHNGQLRFQGEAWATDAQDQTVLSNLLHVLGQRIGTKTLLKVG